MPRLFRGTKRQLARIREEIGVFNRNVDRLERLYGTNQGLPEKVTYDGILDRIQTENDFRRIVGYKNDVNRRPSELQRFRAGVRSDAQRINPETGNTYYVDRELSNNMRSINMSAKKEREARGLDWENLTPMEKAREAAKGNVATVKKGKFKTPQDLTELQNMRAGVTPFTYMNNYLDAWEENRGSVPYRETVEDIIIYMYNNDEDRLRGLLGRIDDEATIEYLYEWGLYKGIDNDTRMRNVYNYWLKEDIRKG